MRGTLGEFWHSANGIIQGDALSMIALNSLVSVILEKQSHSATPGITARSYADGISAVMRRSDRGEVRRAVTEFHRIVQQYADSGCGELNVKKSFTFGDKEFEGQVVQGMEHMKHFKIVGGSLVVRDTPLPRTGTDKSVVTRKAKASTQTKVEELRLQKWQESVTRLRHYPSRLEGQGKYVHRHADAVDLRTRYTQRLFSERHRSVCMRTLWKAGFYSMSPSVTFAILAPVGMDPEFGIIHDGLRAIMRACRDPTIHAEFRKRVMSTHHTNRDGPTARLRHLIVHPALGPMVTKLVHHGSSQEEEGQWLHDIREAWRNHLWKRAIKERKQHHGDCTNVDRVRTMRYHDELHRIANEETEEETPSLEVVDARMRIMVLRRIIAGGVMTQERNSRHQRMRDNQMSKMCTCGEAEETVEHVAWHCRHHMERRRQALRVLKGARLTVSMKYAGIIQKHSKITDEQVREL